MLAAITLMLAQASTPSPLVYLDCLLDYSIGDRQVPWQITLNEAQQTVEYTPGKGHTRRRPARFTADAVYFEDNIISRVDLTFASDGVNAIGQRTWARGTCRLVEPKIRAF